jgi:MFS family permease
MMWEGARSTFLYFATLNSACAVLTAVLILAFTMRFVQETVGRVGRRQWIAFSVFAAFSVAVLICWCVAAYAAVSLPFVGTSNVLLAIIEYTGFAASLAYLAIGWRRSEKQQRERFALFLTGVAALTISQLIAFVVFVQLGQLFSQSHPLLIIGELLSGVVAPLLLTHAILRHRVFDLGFILNRTLVYGTVSAILLVSFGVIEWGVDHFVKIQGHERNALVDAAIALGVYLLFHKFRHTTEHRLEAFFFREWHAREATVRRSVAKAGFITAHQPLILATTQAFEQFSGGATVKLYLKDESGEYAPCDSSGPAIDPAFDRIDRDAPLVVEMRAEPTPHRLDGTGPALALPMVHRNELLGFVLLGAKPDNSDYRTDEVDLLGWAAHQLGLDLHALNVDRLEAIVRDQNQQLKIFQAIDARYRSNVSNPN